MESIWIAGKFWAKPNESVRTFRFGPVPRPAKLRSAPLRGRARYTPNQDERLLANSDRRVFGFRLRRGLRPGGAVLHLYGGVPGRGARRAAVSAVRPVSAGTAQVASVKAPRRESRSKAPFAGLSFTTPDNTRGDGA